MAPASFSPCGTTLVCDQIAIALDRTNLMASIQQQAKQLQQANRIKDEFLAVLSHELRSPLNPILGWSRLLQGGTFLLEQQGAQVMTATSAPEALSLLSQIQPQILLSDIGMPGMDGYMLIQQVRALAPEQGGQIPVIALTAYAGEEDRQQVLSAGFQHHVPQPIEPGLLMRSIIAALVRQ